MATDQSKLHYDRLPGEVAVHMDIFDAEAKHPEQFGSRQYFLVGLSDRFAALLQKSELHKLKGFFEKRNTLKETTIERFTDNCLCILCPSSVAALHRLQKDYESKRLERFFIECFVTPVALKKLEVTSLKLKIRIWESELQQVEAEWKDGVMPQKYDMANNEKSRRMLKLVRQFQLKFVQDPQSGAGPRLREAEAKFEASFSSLINYLKMLRNSSMVAVQTIKEVKEVFERERHSVFSPDEKTLEQYLATLQEVGRVVRTVESSISFPMEQIRVGGENEEQQLKKREIFQLIHDTKEVLREDSPLRLRHETYVAKISGSEKLVYAGFVSLLPCAVRMVLDIDEAIDEYFSSGSVVFKPTELAD